MHWHFTTITVLYADFKQKTNERLFHQLWTLVVLVFLCSHLHVIVSDLGRVRQVLRADSAAVVLRGYYKYTLQRAHTSYPAREPFKINENHSLAIHWSKTLSTLADYTVCIYTVWSLPLDNPVTTLQDGAVWKHDVSSMPQPLPTVSRIHRSAHVIDRTGGICARS